MTTTPTMTVLSDAIIAPHEEHIAASGAAHWPQNRIPGGFSCWHRGHFIQPS
jgi:hypothetical protein